MWGEGGGGAENTFFSVTPYNFQISVGVGKGGAEVPLPIRSARLKDLTRFSTNGLSVGFIGHLRSRGHIQKPTKRGRVRYFLNSFFFKGKAAQR